MHSRLNRWLLLGVVLAACDGARAPGSGAPPPVDDGVTRVTLDPAGGSLDVLPGALAIAVPAAAVAAPLEISVAPITEYASNVPMLAGRVF
ncbi:MAG: hypothetical protein AAB426_00260, partial [Myxococcota bacterium]